jgi:hypothetical protein
LRTSELSQLGSHVLLSDLVVVHGVFLLSGSPVGTGLRRKGGEPLEDPNFRNGGNIEFRREEGAKRRLKRGRKMGCKRMSYARRMRNDFVRL